MKSGGAIFFIFLTLVAFGYWVCGIEVPAVRVLVLQHRAESFMLVQGRVLSGEVMETRGSKGKVSYRPSFWYGYQVAGAHYSARRYRYDGHPWFSTFAAANEMVKAHPTGSEIEVYYNPANPSEAVLSRPVAAFDLGPVLMGFTLGLVPLYFIIKFGQMIVSTRKAASIAGGVKIISEGTTTRVRLPERDPLSWSVMTIGVLSFIAGAVASANVKLEVAEMMVLLVVVGGGAVYFWLRKKISSGSQDLVIDESDRTLQLPRTYKRPQTMRCGFSDVSEVALEKVPHRGKYGVRHTYAPALVIAGQPQRLTDLSKRRAEAFAVWLRGKLGMPAADSGRG